MNSFKKKLIWSNPINYIGNVYTFRTLIDSSFILNKSSDNLFEMTSNKQSRVLFTYLWFPNLYLHIVQSINKIVTMGGLVFCVHYFFVNFVLFFWMPLYEPLNLANQTRWTLLIVCIFFWYKIIIRVENLVLCKLL